MRIILLLIYVFCFRLSSMNAECITSLIMLISRSNTMMGQGKTGKELVWCLQRSHQEGMNCTNNTVREGHSGLMVCVLSWTLELRGLGLGLGLGLGSVICPVHCVLLVCETLNSHSATPTMFWETCQNAGQDYWLALHATEIGISSYWRSHLMRVHTLFVLFFFFFAP